MNAKTVAQQQLEFLKKLKEQKKAPPPRPATRPAADAAFTAAPLALRVRRRKKMERNIPVTEAAWQRLQREGISSLRFKLNKGLGDWAIELLLGMPDELQSLSADARHELFDKIKAWSASRGLK